MDKFFNRSNSPLNAQPKLDEALVLYSRGDRSLFSKMQFRLELDACVRWCSLLLEQSDMKVSFPLYVLFCSNARLSNRNIAMTSLTTPIASLD